MTMVRATREDLGDGRHKQRRPRPCTPCTPSLPKKAVSLDLLLLQTLTSTSSESDLLLLHARWSTTCLAWWETSLREIDVLECICYGGMAPMQKDSFSNHKLKRIHERTKQNFIETIRNKKNTNIQYAKKDMSS